MLVLFFAIPGVVIDAWAPRCVVALAMAAVAGVVSSVLGDRRGRGSSSGAPAAAPDAAPTGPRTTARPGVLFLQIDGLGHDVARRAVRDGSMPTLAAWLRAGSHVLTAWHTDWSSQTGAACCGILHGSNHDILGFRWYEKDRDHVVRVSAPEDAAALERRHSDGRGPARRRTAPAAATCSPATPRTSA